MRHIKQTHSAPPRNTGKKIRALGGLLKIKKTTSKKHKLSSSQHVTLNKTWALAMVFMVLLPEILALSAPNPPPAKDPADSLKKDKALATPEKTYAIATQRAKKNTCSIFNEISFFNRQDQCMIKKSKSTPPPMAVPATRNPFQEEFFPADDPHYIPKLAQWKLEELAVEKWYQISAFFPEIPPFPMNDIKQGILVASERNRELIVLFEEIHQALINHLQHENFSLNANKKIDIHPHEVIYSCMTSFFYCYKKMILKVEDKHYADPFYGAQAFSILDNSNRRHPNNSLILKCMRLCKNILGPKRTREKQTFLQYLHELSGFFTKQSIPKIADKFLSVPIQENERSENVRKL